MPEGPHKKGSATPMEQKNRFHLNAGEAVLLVIDLQERLMAAMDHAPQVLKNTKLLLLAAEQLQFPVLVTEQYPKGLGATSAELLEAMPEGWTRIEKTAFDAAGPELLDKLSALGRKTVVVCGSETHVCVYQTVRSLLEQGYQVFLVEDAVCSRFTHNYKSGLALMREMGAVVLTAEGAVFDLLKVSGTSAFRVLSKALK